MKTRKAIGAIIFSKDKFLVLKRCAMLTKNGMRKISPEWDLLKGGIEEGEREEIALMREIFEETGSRKYIISKKFKEKLVYNLPVESEFSKQEVTMFLVEYVGDKKDLMYDEEEIMELKFFNKDESLSKIKYEETKEFFRKHV
ncbi:MAG: NUDIX domain-containing protein [Candidatus Nanoarchaeia archaeon]